MAQSLFHASIEGAQHGAKSLDKFLDYAKASGAASKALPSAAQLASAAAIPGFPVAQLAFPAYTF